MSTSGRHVSFVSLVLPGVEGSIECYNSRVPKHVTSRAISCIFAGRSASSKMLKDVDSNAILCESRGNDS